MTWLLLLAVLAVALAIGAQKESRPLTEDQQVRAIASRVRCPTCRGLSAAVSDAPAAEAIRDEVRRRLLIGERDDEVIAYLVGSYGQDIVLEPEASGAGLVVWVLPGIFVLASVAGVAIVLGRRRSSRPTGVSAEDRDLVDRARAAADG